MKEFIQGLPKAELHLHIEGTLEPELMLEMAKRNNVQLPYKSLEEVKEAYQFNSLQDFLDLYYIGTLVLVTEKDFYDLTFAYLVKCKEQNILHTEIMFEHQSYAERGISFATVINGIHKATVDAKDQFGISSILILTFIRHLSEESALQTLEQSLPYKDKIKAVGLASAEVGNPPSKFANVYKKSIEAGYLTTAHAGEEGPPEYIWEALDLLKVQRVDHGNNAFKDDNLVEEIKARDIVLTMCPLSNLALKVETDIETHTAREAMDRGVQITINSDDPSYFGGYLVENYVAIQKALSLRKKDLCGFARNSFKYSFLEEKDKKFYIDKVDEYCG